MQQRWSVEEIVASLEAQATHHRERASFHAGQEASHGEKKREHTEELAELTRRLAEFQAASAAALELAGRKTPAQTAEAAGNEDFGSASNPRLTRMVNHVLAGLGAGEPFGANGVLDQLHQRFTNRLRKRPTLRQISDVLRRLDRQGRIHRLHGGRPHHEARYVKEPPPE